MYKLNKFYNKRVNIITNDGEKFSGLVTDYICADDNDPEKESIVIDTSDGEVIEFFEDDIAIITIGP